MITKLKRFMEFMREEETRRFFACIYYIFFIATCIKYNLPLYIGFMGIHIMCMIYIVEWGDEICKRNKGKIKKKIVKKIKDIAKEIIMFIPVLIIYGLANSFIFKITEVANETRIINEVNYMPVNLLEIIIIGPIIEEVIFRILPYKFIKNKKLYVIISSVIFASMHVINDPNALHNIWAYMILSLYFGYRYYKKRDLCINIAIHSFNNLISCLPIILNL